MPNIIIGKDGAFQKGFFQTDNNVPTGGLISYWPFDGNLTDVVGSNDAFLESGDSEVYDPDNVSGGQSIEMDGTYTGVQLLENSDIPNEYAFSVWFKSTSTIGDSQARVISRDRSDYWNVEVDQSAPFPQDLKYDGAGIFETLNSVIQSDTWHHVVVNVDDVNETVQYIFDGDVDIRTIGYNPSGASIGVGILTNVEAGAGDDLENFAQFIGLEDEIRFYNRTLTTQEALDIYNTENPN